jgi:hypothetical protein
MTAQTRTVTDAPEALRDVAEKSEAQAKENLEKMSAAAGEASNLLKHSNATTFKGTQDYSAKVLESTNANINAAVEQATKLTSVKSPMEFFALSNDYAKRQFEILTRTPPRPPVTMASRKRRSGNGSVVSVIAISRRLRNDRAFPSDAAAGPSPRSRRCASSSCAVLTSATARKKSPASMPHATER